MTRIGIEIGGTKQQIVLGDSEGKVLDRCRFSVDSKGDGSLIRGRLAEELLNFIEDHRPERIGVGFGGPVDRINGTVAISHQIESWSGFPIRDWLNDLTGLPVTIENAVFSRRLRSFAWGSLVRSSQCPPSSSRGKSCAGSDCSVNRLCTD